MSKHVGEKCGKLCISLILSSQRGITPSKIDSGELKTCRNFIKIRQNDLVQKDVKNVSKIWLQSGTKNNNIPSHMLLNHCYMHSVCCCSLPVCRRRFLKKGTPVTYFGPALDPPLGRSGQKTTTSIRHLEYFMHIKFHQNPFSSSGEEVENVNSLTHDKRTDAGQGVITIGHCSLWLLHPKQQQYEPLWFKSHSPGQF